MNRRRAISLVGGALMAWPVAAQAQQQTVPVVGYLSSVSAKGSSSVVTFLQGLKEAGFVEGQNVAIEYRWANGQYDKLPELAADLVRRPVAVIFANTAAVPVAKMATRVIPIVFQVGSDPVKSGIVSSLNHPAGNLTGIVSLNSEVGPKRLEVMHELVPAAKVMALLVNPANPITAAVSRDAQTAANTLKLQLHVLHATTEREIDDAFATLFHLGVGALVMGPDAFLSQRSDQVAALAARHKVPTISPYKSFAVAGGLLSYGGNNSDAFRLAGVYTGRILKGEKPSDLPVQQVTKVELVLNLKTAKALGLVVPLPLLGRADEVIE